MAPEQSAIRSRAARRGRAVTWLRRAALALAGSVMLGAAVWVWLDRRWESEVRAEVAAMGRDGLLVPLGTLLPSAGAVRPADNAASEIWQAIELARDFSAALPDAVREQLQAYALDGTRGLRRGLQLRNGGPMASQAPGMAAPGLAAPGSPIGAVSENDCRRCLGAPKAQEVLRLLEAASRRPRCGFPARWDESGFPWLGLPRPTSAASDLLVCWARLQLAAGRRDEALRWYTAGLRICRHLASVPPDYGLGFPDMLNALLPGLQEAVAGPGVSASQLREVDRLLASIDRAQIDAAAGEPRLNLAVHNQFYETLRREPGAAYRRLGFLWDETRLRFAARLYYSRAARPLQRLDHLRYLQTVRPIIPLVPQPYCQTRAQWQALGDRLSAAQPSGFFVDFVDRTETGDGLALLYSCHWPASWPMLCMSYRWLAENRDILSARIGLVRTSLALVSYKAAHGRYPASLEELSPSAPAPLWRDPFSGRAYGYTRTAGGFRLYSVGPDLVDDRGEKAAERYMHYGEGDIVFDGLPPIAR